MSGFDLKKICNTCKMCEICIFKMCKNCEIKKNSICEILEFFVISNIFQVCKIFDIRNIFKICKNQHSSLTINEPFFQCRNTAMQFQQNF